MPMVTMETNGRWEAGSMVTARDDASFPVRHIETLSIGEESTVVAAYDVEPRSSEDYQSEAALERALIDQLQRQAYEYVVFPDEAALIANLRRQLEALNGLAFSDAEWKRFFTQQVASSNAGIVEKTRTIQQDHIKILTRDDGTKRNIYLLDKAHIHNNRLQVTNQYATDAGSHDNRYDVTILVNGLPLVHIELKRRGVDIREAFNQITRYQRESFWAGTGLFEYVQIFVISNGTLTKYYSNTTRDRHVKELHGGARSRRVTSNSFEFTSWWADARNRRIEDLRDFARTFLSKHSLLNILTRYCVLDSDDQLLVMRPYQIAAVERILNRIEISTNARQLGTAKAGGYIWHTTGSGKTLTSFKTAQLATDLDFVDKVLFVVDRKDLDYQTMKEYDRFEKGAANSSESTAQLAANLGDASKKIVITTIQKLALFVKAHPHHGVYDQHVVIVFDECHRSQFGDMHQAITKHFRRYHLFGFTGTPIFAANAGSGGKPDLKTTEQAFGDRLHSYTIVDAINDHNVLPFRIDYANTIRTRFDVADKQVPGIDTEAAMLDPRRVREVVAYILEHFDQKTKRAVSYQVKDRRVRGFNSLFATASIGAAKRYYSMFQELQAERVPDQRLRVALVYSYAPNGVEPDGLLAEEDFETRGLDVSSRDFLDGAIADYNQMFRVNYDSSSKGFQDYYSNVTEKLRNRELDLVIVVNMLLTGFDATTLNTLWVDKNLRQHGLIQAFSRTNRILNSVKAYGNIVCFRNLEQETNDALKLFGNPEAGGIVVLKPYTEYLGEYQEAVARLLEEFPLSAMPLVGEDAEKAFIALYGTILKLRNILTSFDDFDEDAKGMGLDARMLQDYQSRYLELHQQYAERQEGEKERINEDVVFEIELVKQVEVTVDYILMLVQEWIEDHGSAGGEDTEVRAQIARAVDSSPSLRNKKDLIEDFVDSMTVRDWDDGEGEAGGATGAGGDAGSGGGRRSAGSVPDRWASFIERRRAADLEAIIRAEHLDPDGTSRLIDAAFRDGELPTSGTDITRIMPKVSRFGRRTAMAGAEEGDAGSRAGSPQSLAASGGGAYGETKSRIVEKLLAFVEKYRGLV